MRDWWCGVHKGVMLVRKHRPNSGISPGLLICRRAYCPACWRMQMDEIKRRGMKRAVKSSRAAQCGFLRRDV